MAFARVQLTTQSGQRMIQLQSTRFHYNWQKKGEGYPSYQHVRKDFEQYFDMLCRFVEEAELGEIQPNQWEKITYVDHIPKGELWDEPKNWNRVLPGLFGAYWDIEGLPLESLGGQWHYEIHPQQGRVHIACNMPLSARKHSPPWLLPVRPCKVRLTAERE